MLSMTVFIIYAITTLIQEANTKHAAERLSVQSRPYPADVWTGEASLEILTDME